MCDKLHWLAGFVASRVSTALRTKLGPGPSCQRACCVMTQNSLAATPNYVRQA